MPESCPRTCDNLVSRTSHADAAQRLRNLAEYLANNPEEARAFRVKTGVHDQNGKLTPAYR